MTRILSLALPVFLGLVLAGCQDETDAAEAETATSASRFLSISDISHIAWPPDADPGAEPPAIQEAVDPLAENSMVVLDMSGSMQDGSCAGAFETRADAAKDALFTWIAAHPGNNIGLIAFSMEGYTLLPLGSGKSHAENLIDTIRGLTPGGNTPLRSAMERAQTELEAQARRQLSGGAYRMIVITDGKASFGENPVEVVERIVYNPANLIEIHTVGFCIRGGHSLNDPQTVFYVDANSPDEIVAGLEAATGEAENFDDTFETSEEKHQ